MLPTDLDERLRALGRQLDEQRSAWKAGADVGRRTTTATRWRVPLAAAAIAIVAGGLAAISTQRGDEPDADGSASGSARDESVVVGAPSGPTATDLRAAPPTQDHPLVGAWLLTDGQDADSPAALVSFGADGIYRDTDVVDGRDSYGAWEATGPSSAAVTLVQPFPESDDGDSEGLVKIRAVLEVSADSASFTGEYTLEVEGVAGVPAGEYVPGTVTGTRISVEPMGTPAGPLDELGESLAVATSQPF